ncbi:uncharacterized protein LOC105437122 isoform X3 [Strongylocentrotus purpuratus]|uniref:SET domain-containing protein n=1 Tax=Strongylocentrotus purpuratus TaxID=7668 RepID=A0A7M7P945_STRPU|nr:uncharacterized protein LOC105437122 isoform X3 [Strongylocentrotus purpuratus]
MQTQKSTMVGQRRKRIKPDKEAEIYIRKQEDKQGFVVKEIPLKGRGVVTTEEFDNGDFLLQYPGKLLPESVAEALEEDEGHPSVFRYFFSFKGKTSCYDATEETEKGPSYGRLVNHGEPHERNCNMKVISVEDVPYLCLFASETIRVGSELLYDYGLPDAKLPWKHMEQPPSPSSSPLDTSHQEQPPSPSSSPLDTSHHEQPLSPSSSPLDTSHQEQPLSPSSSPLDTSHQEQPPSPSSSPLDTSHQEQPPSPSSSPLDTSHQEQPPSPSSSPLDTSHQEQPPSPSSSPLDTSHQEQPPSPSSSPLDTSHQEQPPSPSSSPLDTSHQEQPPSPSSSPLDTSHQEQPPSPSSSPLDTSHQEQPPSPSSSPLDTSHQEQPPSPSSSPLDTSHQEQPPSPSSSPLDTSHQEQPPSPSSSPLDTSHQEQPPSPSSSPLDTSHQEQPLSPSSSPLDTLSQIVPESHYLRMPNVSGKSGHKITARFSKLDCLNEVDSFSDSSDNSVLDPTYEYDLESESESHDSLPECIETSSVNEDVASGAESNKAESVMFELPQKKAKRNYSKPSRVCPFCHKSCGEKLTRHITQVHKHEKSVKDALKLPKKERNVAMSVFKKQGILHANQNQIKKKDPQYQRERKCNTNDKMTICGLCKGFYSKPYFKRHKRYCRGDTAAEACAVPVSLLMSNVQVNEDVSEFTTEILSKFRDDEIGEVCRTDEVITNIGQRLWSKERSKRDKRSQVRKSVMASMRRLASLYALFKQQHAIHGNSVLQNGNAGDMFDRLHFHALSEAITVYTTGEESGQLKSGLKSGLYYLLKLACKFTKATYLSTGDDRGAEEIDKFIAVLELNHSFLFGDATYAINKNRQVKLRKPDALPLEADMQKLRTYSVDGVQEIVSDEYLVWDIHNFKNLRDMTVSRLTLFNARRGGEPCRLNLSEWEEANADVWIDKQRAEDIDDPLERDMLQNFKVAYQTGKGNNHLVPVLFPKDTVEAMQRLCDPEVREMVGIPSDNTYVFTCTQKSMSHVTGWHALNSICKAAGIVNKAQINATKNRHRVSTMYAAFELPEAKRALFFKHMGHSGMINENIYQTPLAIQEVTQVGSILQHIDSGVGTGSHTLASQQPSVSSSRQPLVSSSRPLQSQTMQTQKSQRRRCVPFVESQSDSDDPSESGYAEEGMYRLGLHIYINQSYVCVERS